MKRAFKAHVSCKKYDYIFACDIVSLQILSGFDLPGKVYWAFELIGIRKKLSFSWDGVRSLFFYHYLNKMNLLIVPSEQREELFSVGAMKVRRFVLGNWRSKDRIFLALKNQKTPNDSTKIKLVFAGKISFNSGIQRIIPKIAEHSIFSLTLVGNMDEQFRQWFEGNKFENVDYVGFVSNEQLIPYLRKFDISVCSYDTIGVTNISALNPAPTKVGDAIASGVMILSSDQKYLKDIVENKNLGFCYSEQNLSEVLAKISRLKRFEIDEFKQRVRESFEMDYCMEVNIPELLNVLEQNE
ncbi:MAG: glycosyltransferase [Cyclobacteriaceae bacterium]|nr:glycosyltransferase [Cyclobacteriaceae bacterium]